MGERLYFGEVLEMPTITTVGGAERGAAGLELRRINRRQRSEPMTDKDTWSALLADFTRRNAGRRARLEVIDPQFGAQWQEVDYPLLGIAYDPRDDRIEIMLGYLGSTEQHLTRSITAAIAIDLRPPNSGGGETLRVTHGDAQTLVHLEAPGQHPTRTPPHPPRGVS
jgi:hypothetical protein